MGGTTHHAEGIFQTVYVSTATIPMKVEDILAIEEVSSKNNKELGLTGLLTYCSSKFMQFLEGKQENVEAILSKIQRDSRHHSIDILRQGPLSERQFTDWFMRYTSIDEIQQYHGFLHNKLFDNHVSTQLQNEKAKETLALLVAFKNSCRNQTSKTH